MNRDRNELFKTVLQVLAILGLVAIVVMLKAPRGLWGLVIERFGFQLFSLERRVVLAPTVRPGASGDPDKMQTGFPLTRE